MLSKSLFDKIRCIFFSVMRKFSVILLAALIAGVGMDAVRTWTYQPMYKSELSAIVMASNQKFEQLDETRSYIKAMGYILNGDFAKEYVRKEMKNEDIDYTCTVTSEDDSNFVTISVVSDKRQNSYYVLKHLMVFSRLNQNMYTIDYHLNVFKSAKFDPDPINTNRHSVNFAAGFLIGGFLCVAYFTLIELLKKRVRTESDIQEYIASRIFAKVPREKKSGNGHRFWEKDKSGILVSSFKTSFEYKEAIKNLRHRIESNARKHGYKSILVTSASENEGKSTIITNLAIALAMRKHRVLLIDSDIIKPSIHQLLEADTERCINNYLFKGASWQSQVQRYNHSSLFVLTSEKIDNNQEAVLESEKFRTLLEEAKEHFDYVLIDCSPSGHLNDAIILNRCVDASLIVIKQNTALCSMINETIFRLKNAKDNLIGCIYNENLKSIAGTKNSYRYGYKYYSDRGGK